MDDVYYFCNAKVAGLGEILSSQKYVTILWYRNYFIGQ